VGTTQRAHDKNPAKMFTSQFPCLFFELLHFTVFYLAISSKVCFYFVIIKFYVIRSRIACADFSRFQHLSKMWQRQRDWFPGSFVLWSWGIPMRLGNRGRLQVNKHQLAIKNKKNLLEFIFVIPLHIWNVYLNVHSTHLLTTNLFILEIFILSIHNNNFGEDMYVHIFINLFNTVLFKIDIVWVD